MEALDLLSRQHPSIIVLDLMMPEMDGLTFLSERQKRAVAPQVPVICRTAASEEMMARARRLGATACISKPFDLGGLCAAVKELAERRL